MLDSLILDRGCEATASRMPQRAAQARAWRGDALDPARCVLRLGPEHRAELAAVAGVMHANPLPVLLRNAADFAIPRLRALMARAKGLLDGVPGVAVVDALPLDDMDEETARAVYWILGQCIARPVAQKWDGSMFYDVTDTGRAFGYGVRGSWTNVELNFHTDNAFALAPPSYVGLLCFHPAREGGLSRFCSLHAVHEALRRDHPDALERLYHPMLWDRQAEHAPGAAKVLRAPMFSYRDGRLCSRANLSLVRKGYQVAGEAPDAALVAALAALETVSADPGLWFELPIARGHLQFLNNVDTAHYRSGFVDHDDPARRRRLLRTWHRDAGAPSYDG